MYKDASYFNKKAEKTYFTLSKQLSFVLHLSKLELVLATVEPITANNHLISLHSSKNNSEIKFFCDQEPKSRSLASQLHNSFSSWIQNERVQLRYDGHKDALAILKLSLTSRYVNTRTSGLPCSR